MNARTKTQGFDTGFLLVTVQKCGCARGELHCVQATPSTVPMCKRHRAQPKKQFRHLDMLLKSINWRYRNLSDLIKKIFIWVPKMNESCI